MMPFSQWAQSWKKFPTSFSVSANNFCFSLVFCENFQYLISFNEVSESVDGLEIRVNPVNPNIKNSVVIIFDSNLINCWRMIFQNPKKFSKYHFSFKSYSDLKYLRIFTDFRPFTNKMFGKNTHRIYGRIVWKILTVRHAMLKTKWIPKNSIYNVYVNSSIWRLDYVINEKIDQFLKIFFENDVIT